MRFAPRLGRLLPFVFFTCASVAFARAERGIVTSGRALISDAAAGALTIKQTSPTVVIEWSRFDVDENETVLIQQPSSSSIAVIRVHSGSAVSRIAGRVAANGQVWLVNPSGIWFGPDARVRATGFVARGDAVTVSGTLDASSRGSGESGGSVRVQANTIDLTRTALIDSGAAIQSRALMGTVGDLNWHLEGVGDFDGDLKADLLWRKVSTGDVAIWLMNASQIKQPAAVTRVNNITWTVMAPR